MKKSRSSSDRKIWEEIRAGQPYTARRKFPIKSMEKDSANGSKNGTKRKLSALEQEIDNSSNDSGIKTKRRKIKIVKSKTKPTTDIEMANVSGGDVSMKDVSKGKENVNPSKNGFSIFDVDENYYLSGREKVIKATMPPKIQVSKELTHDFAKRVLGIELDLRNYLTDIQFGKDSSGNVCTVVGRPNVLSSSRKQMRHVTPFSFIKYLIDQKAKESNDAKQFINKISGLLTMLLPHTEGLAIPAKELATTPYSKVRSEVVKKSSRSLKDSNGELYVLVSPEKYNKKMFTPRKLEKAVTEYQIRQKQFVESSIKQLINAVPDWDNNTMIMMAELVAKLLLGCFNQREDIVYPEEGNSLPYEIRLFKSKHDAIHRPTDKNAYEVLSSWQIDDLIDEGKNLDKKVRVVVCEGADVRRAKDALVCLNKLKVDIDVPSASCIQEAHTLVKEYNAKYNKSVLLTNSSALPLGEKLLEFNCDLEVKNLSDNIISHIAKQLFIVFDYKALEEYVFVTANRRDKKNDDYCVEVFPSASGKRSVKYVVKKGKAYREYKANEATGYNDKVIFRNEEKFSYDKLAEIIVQHVLISTVSFDQLATEKMHKAILDKFEHLMRMEYKKELKGQVKKFHESVMQYDKNCVSLLDTSSDVNQIIFSNQSEAKVYIQIIGESDFDSYDDLLGCTSS